MVAGHIVPFDAVSVEVVEDGEAGLLAGWLFPGGPVVRLGEAGSARTRGYHPQLAILTLTLRCGTSAGCQKI